MGCYSSCSFGIMTKAKKNAFFENLILVECIQN